jgi:hypothetical protein
MGQFSDKIKKFGEDALQKSTDVMVGAALEVFGRVVKRTPVGNPSLWMGKPPPGYTGGSLRANWQVSINRPADGVVEGTQVKTPDIKADARTKNIHITNNLPYAEPVEYGQSKQAPAGMVRVTAMEFKGIVDGLL